MAKQISLSDEVYNMLSKMKGNKSYSETIKTLFERKQKRSLSKFYGIWKKYDDLTKIESKIIAERRSNQGRSF